MKVFRHIVPVDDRVHKVMLMGDPLSVQLHDDGNKNYYLEFWAEHWDDQPGHTEWARYFKAFGTGLDIPDNARYWGTAPRASAGWIFHLYEMNGE